MGIRLRQLAKTLAVAVIVAAVPQVSAHAENNERWGGRQAWQGYNWHNGGYGGYGGNYDGGGSIFLYGGVPSYYYPPPPAYYYPPPQPYYPPPQPYYPMAPDYYGPQFGLQFNFPLR